jgi:hypothetical protein
MAYKDKNRNKLYLQERRKKYPDKVKEDNKKYYLQHIEKIKLRRKKHYIINKENLALKKKEYYNKNSELILNKTRIRRNKNIDNITDSYITANIQTSMFKYFKIRIKIKDIPKELIELNREQIKLKRLLKN